MTGLPDPNAGDQLAYEDAWENRLRDEPSGLTEELGLEADALAEHERRATAAWQGKRYADARRETAMAAAARARIAELEAQSRFPAP